MKRRVPNLFIKNKRVYPYQTFSDPLLAEIVEWELEEFVDGLLIRIFWDTKKKSIRFRGENEEAFIDEKIFYEAMGIFTVDNLTKSLHPRSLLDIQDIVQLFVRVPIIENKPYFALVDVFCNGQWLDRPEVRIIAAILNINAPGYAGHRSTSDMIDYFKTRPHSFLRNTLLRKVVGRAKHNGKEVIMKFAFKDVPK